MFLNLKVTKFGHLTIAHELVGPPIKPWASFKLSIYILYVYVDQYRRVITHLV